MIKSLLKGLEKNISLLSIIALPFMPPHLYAQGEQQIAWLKSQKTSNGLVDSYKGDGKALSYTYDQALAIIAFTEAKEFAVAQNVIQAMIGLQNPDGSWFSSYNNVTGAVLASAPINESLHSSAQYLKNIAKANQNLDTNKDSGNISWMVMALNYYETQTGDPQYSASADKALGFLEQRIDQNSAHETYGSITHSTDLPTARSTEHCHDAYSAFFIRSQQKTDKDPEHLRNIATIIQDYLRKEMWAPSPLSNGAYHDVNVFWVGFNQNGPPSNLGWYTDPQSWGILSLGRLGPAGEEFFKALDWLWFNPYGSTRNQVPYQGSSLDGFATSTGDLALRGNYIWVEGTEGVAAAFYAIGNQQRGDYFHSLMRKVEQPSGGVLFSVSNKNPKDIRWPDNYRLEAVNATAWHYFNEARINPFKPEKKNAVENWELYH